MRRFGFPRAMSLSCLVLLLVSLPIEAVPPVRQQPAGVPGQTAQIPDLVPEKISFHPQTASKAAEFLKAFAEYTEQIDSEVESLCDGSITDKEYSTLSSLAKKARRRHTAEYARAMKAASSHIQEFKRELALRVDPGSTFLLIQKSAYLVWLMDLSTDQALAVFPIALGAKSVVGPKERPGDLRTPESPPGERSPAKTPFMAHPLIDGDTMAEEGCITRGIGVASKDPRFLYLYYGLTVMLHGTPDRQCMGTRASHGCIRLLPEHIEVLFDCIRDGTKIVIVP
jgi:hypothetical protein